MPGSKTNRASVLARPPLYLTGIRSPSERSPCHSREAPGRNARSRRIRGLDRPAAGDYGAHVHQQACGIGDADGHYKFDPAGPAAPPNEIRPGFTTDAAGVGNGKATVDGTAGPTAVAVVIHAPGGAKIACADLH